MKVYSGYHVNDVLFEDLSEEERDKYLESKTPAFLAHMVNVFANKLNEANALLSPPQNLGDNS